MIASAEPNGCKQPRPPREISRELGDSLRTATARRRPGLTRRSADWLASWPAREIPTATDRPCAGGAMTQWANAPRGNGGV